MANRWERGKLGPYTLPNDFTTGGVGINGISSVTPKEEPFLIPPSTVVYFDNESLINESDNLVIPSGQALSRTGVAALFDVIGTTFGAGDGSTTFNIPNLHHTQNRSFGTAAASGIGQLQCGVMWDHEHQVDLLDGFASVGFQSLTFPQPITQQNAFGNNAVAGSALLQQNVNTRWNDGPFNTPGPSIIPSFGPFEARINNSKGIFANVSRKMFPTIATVNTPIPIGGIIPFIGNDDLTPFDGYLLCNGQGVSASEYPNAALAGITGTPDLRGRFIANFVAPSPGPRTSFHNVGVNHRHQVRTVPQPGPLAIRGQAQASPKVNTGTHELLLQRPYGTNPNNFATASKPTGNASLGPGNETRPVNMAVNYFMRVG